MFTLPLEIMNTPPCPASKWQKAHKRGTALAIPLQLHGATPPAGAFPQVYNIKRSFHRGLPPTKWHSHDHVQIDYVLRGKATVHLPERTVFLRAGALLMILPGHIHSVRADAGTWEILARIQLTENPFRPALDAAHTTQFDWLARTTAFYPRARRLGALLSEVERWWNGTGRYDRYVAEGHLLRFLDAARQTKAVRIERADTDLAPTRDQGLFDMALEFVARNYSNPHLCNADIARGCGISLSLLYKVFSRHTGRGPKEFLRRYRVDRAQEMILEGADSMTRVAHLTGFPDVFTFSRVFKRLTGVPPSRYRQFYEEWLRAEARRSRRRPVAP